MLPYIASIDARRPRPGADVRSDEGNHGSDLHRTKNIRDPRHERELLDVEFGFQVQSSKVHKINPSRSHDADHRRHDQVCR